MAILEVKNLAPSEPLTLYSDLGIHIEFGEYYATSQLQDEKGTFFLLGGLRVETVNGAGLSEETVARFINALDEGNINYALFPGDQRMGQLPLVLDERSRNYIQTELPELITNQYIKWNIYKLPANIDPDDNERASSILVQNDEEKVLELDYSAITPYLREHGEVKEENIDSNDQAFDESMLEAERESKRNQQTEQEEESAFSDELQTGVVADDHEYLDGYDMMDEPDIGIGEDEDEDEEYPQTSKKKSKPQQTETSDEEDFDDFFNETDEDEPSDEISDELPEISDDIDGITDGDDEDFQIPEDAEGEALLDESGKEFDEIPVSLQRVLDSISLPRIAKLTEAGVHINAIKTANELADTYNARIADKENAIKSEILTKYQKRLNASYEAIKEELDTESGSDVVRNAYQKMRDAQKEASLAAEQKINKERNRLEEDFNGPAFEAYKAEVLAGLREKFRDEFYADKVTLPLDDFEEDVEDLLEREKSEVETEFYAWKDGLESFARTKDQKRAVAAVADEAVPLVNEGRKDVEAFQKEVTLQFKELKEQEMVRQTIEAATQSAKDEMARVMAENEYKQRQSQLDADRAKYEQEVSESKSKAEDAESELERLRRQQQEEKEAHERRVERLKREIEDDRHAYVKPQPYYQQLQPVQPEQSQYEPENNNNNAGQVDNNNNDNNTNKDKASKTSKKDRSMLTKLFFTSSGVVAGGILVGTLFFGLEDQHKNDIENHKNEQVQTQSQKEEPAQQYDADKLPPGNYEKGKILKNVPLEDGKKADVVIDKVNKDSVVVHDASKDKNVLDPAKDDKHSFYSIGVNQ